MSMALVACSSAADRALCPGEKTSSTPLVRLGSNIMLRLRTLTFSQPGYRLEMLTDTEGEKETPFVADRNVPALHLLPPDEVLFWDFRFDFRFTVCSTDQE